MERFFWGYSTRVDIDRGQYSRKAINKLEPTIEILDKLTKFYGVTLDELLYMNGKVPDEITIVYKSSNEQLKLIAELDEKDKTIVFGMIETMLTKKKFKDFFNKNVAML